MPNNTGANIRLKSVIFISGVNYFQCKKIVNPGYVGIYRMIFKVTQCFTVYGTMFHNVLESEFSDIV